eukprot:1154956-Pelagomonas_calceolata.AAC.1
MYGDVALPEKEQFKYLGMLVNKHMNLKVSEERAVRPYMAAHQRIKEFGHEHDLRNMPHALIWLSKVYGIPAGMYACQVWGTRHLQEGSVKRIATNWPALGVCGQEPFKTLLQVLKADLHLAGRDDSCWSAHVSKAFSAMRNGDVFQQRILSDYKTPTQALIAALRKRQQKLWREADALSPRKVKRKAVTYHHWCGKSLNKRAPTPFCIPSCLFKDLDKGVTRNVSRFRLRAHGLKVKSCKWLGGSNVCDKCECAEVQDD